MRSAPSPATLDGASVPTVFVRTRRRSFAHCRYSAGQRTKCCGSCQSQIRIGLERTTHSRSITGQAALASIPDSAQIGRRTISLGGATIGASSKSGTRPRIRFIAAIITSWKIGAAPVTPLESRRGVRSKLPTQTPTVTSRVKPIVQLSR